jgi:hypothetical protein
MEVAELQNEILRLRAQLEADPVAVNREIQAEQLYQRSLDKVPIFTGEQGKGNFRQHLANFSVWRLTRNVVDDERAKLALVYSLRDSAGERIRPYRPGTVPYIGAATYEEFENLVRETFLPSGERALSRAEFAAYKQDAAEDCGSYISVKTSLYYMAFTTEERSFITFRNAVIKGLCSNVIKRLVLRTQPQDEEQLRAAIFAAVASEREAYAEGYAESTSLDGLRSVTQFSAMTRRKETEPEPMEIGAMGGSQNNRKKEGCYTCGSLSHFARDCKKGKNQKFTKKPPGGGGGGKRQDGQQKETRDCRKCGVKGHLARDCWKFKRDNKNKVQNLEDEWEEVVDEEVSELQEAPRHFLGGGRPQQHPV